MCGLSPLALWVGTHENPADDPTRGHPLRPPHTLEPSAAAAIEKICQRHRWVYLVTKAQWQARLKTWDQTLGFPGEGPQRRPMPSQNEGRDLRVRVTELTMKRYAARIADFEVWLGSQGLGRLDHLVKNPASLNAALTPYLQGLYNAQKPVSHGSVLLAGLQFFHPCVVGHLSETRTPMPLEVLLAVAVCAWTKGLYRTGMAILLGYHLLLRPSEIGEAKRRHLTLPSDTGGSTDSGVFAVTRSKTAARTTLLQSVIIEDPRILSLAEKVYGSDPPDCLWVRGGLIQLQRNFNVIKRALQLHQAPYTLGSLRAGGAVEFLRRTNNSPGLQIRGRWMSAKSMYHYTQMSVAAISMVQLAGPVRRTILELASIAGSLFDQWQPQRVPELDMSLWQATAHHPVDTLR
eukprot:4993920-Amphidinium_carterae.2